VKYLSGGERSRLLLARVLKNGGNFLILDEPTKRSRLADAAHSGEALIAFPGLRAGGVSHDRYFLNRVCTALWPSKAMSAWRTAWAGMIITWRKRRSPVAAAKEPVKVKATPQKVAAPVEQKKEPASKARKLSWKEAKELEGMEAVIMAEEAEIARIEALFLEPGFHRNTARKPKR